MSSSMPYTREQIAKKVLTLIPKEKRYDVLSAKKISAFIYDLEKPLRIENKNGDSILQKTKKYDSERDIYLNDLENLRIKLCDLSTLQMQLEALTKQGHLKTRERIDLRSKIDSMFSGLTSKDSKNERDYPKFFNSQNHFEFAKKLIENIDRKKPLAECSFIYRAMVDDNFIDAETKQQSIINFFSDYDLSIDRLKTFHACSTENRKRNYSILKDQFQRENECKL